MCDAKSTLKPTDIDKVIIEVASNFTPKKLKNPRTPKLTDMMLKQIISAQHG
jgi:hypothetical protein